MPPHGLTVILADKNKLNASDAQAVENAFKAKLEALGVRGADASEAGERASATATLPHLAQGKPKNRRRSRSIDKSVLAMPEPRRVRDRDHVRLVARQPCLICGRLPADAHHLRFTQSRIFTMTESGSGQGAVTNAITGVLAQPGTPVGVGDVISIYCAGLGPVSPSVAAGIAAPSGPQLSWTVLPTVVTIGGVDAQVTFSGLAPTLAGVYQVNAIVPAGLSPGDAVPVTLTIEGMPSPPVTISIR